MVTGWPFGSGCSKLSRTVKSCWLRDAGICRPLSSNTFETLSALLSSNEAEVMLSSTGTKRTATLALTDCVLGETSASTVYRSTSMRERRSWACPAAAPANIKRIPMLRKLLRNMYRLSFQNTLNDGGRTPCGGHPRRPTRKSFPNFAQTGLHLSACPIVAQQAPGLPGNGLAGHLALHQFGHHRAPGNQIHHRIKRHPHQKLPGQPTRRRDFVKCHHRRSQQRGLHGNRAASGEREIGMRHGVPAFPFYHPDRR